LHTPRGLNRTVKPIENRLEIFIGICRAVYLQDELARFGASQREAFPGPEASFNQPPPTKPQVRTNPGCQG
jgi:hypothetical protein